MTRRLEGAIRVALASLIASVLLLTPLNGPAYAQSNPTDSASVRQVIEGDEQTQQLIQERILDKSGEVVKSTPLTAILGLTERYESGDYEGAAAYLDMRYLPEDLAEWTPEQLIQAIVIVWDQQNILDFSTLSDEPRGNENDGLPLHLELIGTLQAGGEEVPFYLQSVPQADGSREWKISSASVERVPELWKARFGNSVAFRYAMAFVGGLILVFGARLAGGCTSGHGISGALQLAASGWTFFMAVFAAGIATAFALYGKVRTNV